MNKDKYFEVKSKSKKTRYRHRYVVVFEVESTHILKEVDVIALKNWGCKIPLADQKFKTTKLLMKKVKS